MSDTRIDISKYQEMESDKAQLEKEIDALLKEIMTNPNVVGIFPPKEELKPSDLKILKSKKQMREANAA